MDILYHLIISYIRNAKFQPCLELQMSTIDSPPSCKVGEQKTAQATPKKHLLSDVAKFVHEGLGRHGEWKNKKVENR